MFLDHFRLSVGMCFLCLFVVSPACGQEGSAPTLSSLQQQYRELDKSLANLQTQLEAGEGDTESLRSEYIDLVDQSNDKIAEIRTAAIKQIEAKTDDSASATRALMGILLNEANAGDDGQVLKTGDLLIAQGIAPIWFETAAKSQRISIEAREIFDELLIRQREAKANDLPRVKLTTNKGEIVVELLENEAPETVGNFISLVEDDFYTDIAFHRVIENFMAQSGGFRGEDGSRKEIDYTIGCECGRPDTRPHFAGSLSMAHVGRPDTGGSQFFLTFRRTTHLDGKHTVFARVLEGHDVLEDLQRTHLMINGREEEIPDIKKDRIVSAEVIRKRDHVYRPNKTGVDEPPLDEAKETPAEEETEQKTAAKSKAAEPAEPELEPAATEEEASDTEPSADETPETKAETATEDDSSDSGDDESSDDEPANDES